LDLDPTLRTRSTLDPFPTAGFQNDGSDLKRSRTGIGESGPPDLDLRAPTLLGFGSNRERWLRIGRLAGFGARGGGDCSPETAPAAEVRWSWAISVLRGSKLLELGSGRFSAACVIHLGLLRCLGRLGKEETTAARICTAAPAGVRCSGRWDDLRSTTTSAKGEGRHTGAHRGLEVGWSAAEDGRRQRASGGDDRCSWGRSTQGASRCWAPWITSGGSCGASR
jgi:hypothetical protein